MRRIVGLAVIVAMEFSVGVFGAVVVHAPAAAHGAAKHHALKHVKHVPSPLDPIVEDVSRFVETSRGLKFKHKVRASLLDDAAFNKRLLGDKGLSEDDPQLAIDRTLGLVDPAMTAAAAMDEAAHSTDVVGFYDVVANELFVRNASATTPTPYARAVLAHELTHALQDQNFNLNRGLAFGDGDERDVGLDTLAEGDAMRVEAAYYAAMSPDDQKSVDAVDEANTKAAQDEAQKQAQNPVPQWPGLRALDLLTLFPYQYGPDVVRRLITDGGQAALDFAFRHPIVSTEQIMIAQKAKTNEQPLPVGIPPADGAVIGKGTMGVLNVTALLTAQWVTTGWSSDGWAGGSYVAYRNGGTTCVRFTVVMDTADEAVSLRSALDLVGQLHGNTTVTGPRYPKTVYSNRTVAPPANAPVNFTTCGNPAVRSQPEAMKALERYNQANQTNYVYVPTPYTYTPPQTPQPMYSPPSASEPAPPPQQNQPQPNCIDATVVGLCD
jgi:hypothetical protein